MKECQNCLFYEEHKHECRRYPPQCISSLEGDYFTEYPTTLPDEWCGEWQDGNSRRFNQEIEAPDMTC